MPLDVLNDGRKDKPIDWHDGSWARFSGEQQGNEGRRCGKFNEDHLPSS